MNNRIVDLEEKRQKLAAAHRQKKAESILRALEDGAAKLKKQAYELDALFKGELACPRHIYGFLVGDIRRVEEHLKKIREFFPKNMG